MSQIRSFIAVELPPDVGEVVERVVRGLRASAGEAVRWVRPEGIHLTLKFLGDIDVDSVPEISRALDRCATAAKPFGLTLEGVGVFPNPRRPRVIWVGLGGALEPLIGLQQFLEVELEGLGFARERRAFSPHLTLGRVRDGASQHQVKAISDTVVAASVQPGVVFSIRELALMKSDLRPSGAVYTRLHTARLGSGE